MNHQLRCLRALVFRLVTNYKLFKAILYFLLVTGVFCFTLPPRLGAPGLIAIAAVLVVMMFWAFYVGVALPTDLMCSDRGIASRQDIADEINRLRAWPVKPQKE